MAIYPESSQSSSGNRNRNAHRDFMEQFIDEVFQYTDETFNTPIEKPISRFQKRPRGPGRPSIARSLSASQEPPTSIPIDLEDHQHIKTEKRSTCQVCGFIRRKDYQERLKSESGEIRGSIRGANTLWKCTVCGPICREPNCWNIRHSIGYLGRERKRKYSCINR